MNDRARFPCFPHRTERIGHRGVPRDRKVHLLSACCFGGRCLREFALPGGSRATCDEIAQAGGESYPLAFDVTDPGSVEQALETIVEQRRGIDILVNNAGIARDGLLGRMKDSDWDEVISTNLSGAFRMCRAVAKTMIRRRKGRIINVTSTAGETGNPGQANYSASKAGLIGLTKALARETRAP